MRLHCVVGARPNFMKMAPLLRALDRDGRFQTRLIHTGQHYDHILSETFFKSLGMRAPDINLQVGSGSHAQQCAHIMTAYENDLANHPCDRLIVVGDVNSTMACSLVAAKCGVPIAHVEAGLRSFDRSMPEEINRMVTDRLSDLFFVTEPSGVKHLKQEGTLENAIHLVGNLMIDTLFDQIKQLPSPQAPDKPYWVVTLHRPALVDHWERLEPVLNTIIQAAQDRVIHFPCHPRTRQQLEASPRWSELETHPHLKIGPPLDYQAFLQLWRCAEAVLTDSGGLQEESAALGIPCITLRPNTERPITVDMGCNLLVGYDLEKLKAALQKVQAGQVKAQAKPDTWDGQTAQRIVKVLKELPS